jgi:hypothetical protein
MNSVGSLLGAVFVLSEIALSVRKRAGRGVDRAGQSFGNSFIRRGVDAAPACHHVPGALLHCQCGHCG